MVKALKVKAAALGAMYWVLLATSGGFALSVLMVRQSAAGEGGQLGNMGPEQAGFQVL